MPELEERIKRAEELLVNVSHIVARNAEQITQLNDRQEKTQVLMAQILDSVTRLERIALSHESRLPDIESALSALEGRSKRPQ